MCVCMCVYVCMYVCMYVCVCMCVCVCICVEKCLFSLYHCIEYQAKDKGKVFLSILLSCG